MPKSEQRYPPFSPLLGALTATLRFLFRVLTRLHVDGPHQQPPDGPLIYVTNHLHYFDSGLLGSFMTRQGRPLAAEKYEDHPFSVILNMAGAIYIERGEIDREALRQARAVLEDGEVLAVAAEGTRSKTGTLAQGKTGAAYLATRTNATLIPMVCWGTEKMAPAWKKLRRADVYIRFGQPFKLPEGRARTEQLDAYTDEIMTRIAALLPEEYRGVYADHPLLEEKLKELAADRQI